uniref:Pleckstrin homology domain-containing family A member 3 n=1 Tax=Cacopsylla melanoneura TaxID=428564 RepID=A0A8D9EHI7_9HEMI
MRGILWKWTNYWKGWQTRWFILEDGVLSYYLSLEEVNQGCKGSMKVSACEIIISQVDHTRMDLVIPGEKYYYLKAASSQERQQWLIALGSAKAHLCSKHICDQDNVPPDELKSKKSELKLYCDLLMQQVHQIKQYARTDGDHSEPDIQNLVESSKTLEVTCDTFIHTLEDIMKLKTQCDIIPPTVNELNNNKFITKSTITYMRQDSNT